jgi:hypothetical protein
VQVSISASTGSLSESIARSFVGSEESTVARTLLPSAAGLYYTLAFSAPEKTPVNETLDLTAGGSATKPVSLEPATWALTVKAYLNAAASANPANAVASGSVASITVTNGGTTSVQVQLTGITGTGTGTASYTISFLDTVTTAKLVYGTIGGAVTEANLLSGTPPTPVAGIRTITGSVSLSAGYYQIGVYLAYGSLEAGKSAVAHINNGFTTPVVYSFATGAFTEGTNGVSFWEPTTPSTFSNLTASGDSTYTPSTWLTLTFSNALDLMPGEITLSGGATVNGPPSSSNGTTWTLPITATSDGDGTVDVTVTHPGVSPAQRSVTVHNPITYTVTANGEGAAATLLTFTFSRAVSGLAWSQIGVSGGASKSGAPLTGGGTTWSVPITTTNLGTASIMINHSGVDSSYHKVYVNGAESLPITLSSGSWYPAWIVPEEEQTYRFSATAGTTYYIQWDDSNWGSGSYSTDISVSGSGAGITSFSNADSGYTTERSVFATTSGYITLTVSSSGTGTYAIRYSTTATTPGLTFTGGLSTTGIPNGLMNVYKVYIVPTSVNTGSGAAITTMINSFTGVAEDTGGSGNTVTLRSYSPYGTWAGTGNYKVVCWMNGNTGTSYPSILFKTATVSFTNGRGTVNLSSMGNVY